MLAGNYAGGVEMSVKNLAGPTVAGDLSADFTGVTGEADFLSAFSTNGSFDTNLVFGNGTLCSVLGVCASGLVFSIGSFESPRRRR